MELAQKTCVQPQTRSNTAVATGSVQPYQDQPPAVTERDAQLDVRWWCFDIDLLTRYQVQYQVLLSRVQYPKGYYPLENR